MILLHLALQQRTLRDDAAVSERIRFYRRRAQMSISALAEQCEISRDTLMRYESGETEPDLETLKNMAAILNIQADKLFDEYFAFLATPYSAAIKAMRKRLGQTQREFGALLGVHRKTVLRWEKGEMLVTRPVWEKSLNI